MKEHIMPFDMEKAQDEAKKIKDKLMNIENPTNQDYEKANNLVDAENMANKDEVEVESKELLKEGRYAYVPLINVQKEFNNLKDEEKELFSAFSEGIIVIDDDYVYNDCFRKTGESLKLPNMMSLGLKKYGNLNNIEIQEFIDKLKDGKGRILTDLDWHELTNMKINNGGKIVTKAIDKEIFTELIGQERYESTMKELVSATKGDYELIESLSVYYPDSINSFVRDQHPNIQGILMYKYCKENNIPCQILTTDIGHAVTNLPYLVKAGIISLDELRVLFRQFDSIKDEQVLSLVEEMKKVDHQLEGERYPNMFFKFGDLLIANKSFSESWYFAIKNIIKKED